MFKGGGFPDKSMKKLVGKSSETLGETLHAIQERVIGNDARRVAIQHSITNREIKAIQNGIITSIDIDNEVNEILMNVQKHSSLHKGGRSKTKSINSYSYNAYLTTAYQALELLLESEPSCKLCYLTVQLNKHFSELLLNPDTTRRAREQIASKLQCTLSRKKVGFCVIEQSPRKNMLLGGLSSPYLHLHIVLIGKESEIKKLNDKENRNSFYGISTKSKNALCFQFSRRVNILRPVDSPPRVSSTNMELDIGFVDYISKNLNKPLCKSHRNIIVIGISQEIQALDRRKAEIQQKINVMSSSKTTDTLKLELIHELDLLIF